jgi:TctA family transporter
MAQRGEAGRAIGASLAASAVGGVFGAIFLAALTPLVQPAVLAFGPAEFFAFALLGITFIGSVSGGNPAKGWLVGALGLMLSCVGTEAQTGVERFSLGQPFLWDGLEVTVVLLAIFAVPESLAIASKGRVAHATGATTRYAMSDVVAGMVDVARHRWLTLRTSFIGAVIGLVPGLGGDVASWVCYGHAVQSSSSPERFGHGAVEGVIGPEAANNSKEGGALLPTLFFGIPGSSGMAVMLGAFVVLGIQPGPGMAREHLDLVWVLIWTLVVANIVAAALFMVVGRWLALAVHLRAGLLVPVVLLMTCLGVLLAGGHWQNLAVLVALSALGWAFKLGEWPRAPLAIGLVLGPVMEASLHQSLVIWGPTFVLRPVAATLLTATVAAAYYSTRLARRVRAVP